MTMRLARLAALGVFLGVVACSEGGGGGTGQAAATPSPQVSASAGRTVATPTLPPGIAGTPAQTPPPPTPTAPPSATGPPPLTFTGAMTGQASGVTSAGPCGRLPAGFAANLHFSLSSRPFALSIALGDYHGPASYSIPPERVAVTSGPNSTGQLYPAIRGSVTVDAGERSGHIDAVIGDGSTRISGSWACS